MTIRRPLIGVTTSEHKSRKAWFFDWLAVRRAGGTPVRLSPANHMAATRLDGLIVGGGDDISAGLYGGHLALDIRVDPERDRLELDMLEHFLPLDRPVLGICRGAQMINVFLGGTLISDIYEAFPQSKRLRTVLPRKRVRLSEHSRLRQLLKVSSCRVNSLHHQAVEKLGSGLEIAARDTHGMIQAIESGESRMLIGVQWHPEFLVFNRPQQCLFRTVVQEAMQR